jgi:type II secretory pathway pseudopilin PulG
LTELIIVIVILGILAILALTQYGSYKETALDKEVKANLKLIMAAEKIYRMWAGGYFPGGSATASNTSDINKYLKLFLSTAPNRSWDYSVTTDNATPATCSQATRSGATPRTWRLRNTETEPVTGTCP